MFPHATPSLAAFLVAVIVECGAVVELSWNVVSASRKDNHLQDGVKFRERIDKLTELVRIQSPGVEIGTVA